MLPNDLRLPLAGYVEDLIVAAAWAQEARRADCPRHRRDWLRANARRKATRAMRGLSAVLRARMPDVCAPKTARMVDACALDTSAKPRDFVRPF